MGRSTHPCGHYQNQVNTCRIKVLGTDYYSPDVCAYLGALILDTSKSLKYCFSLIPLGQYFLVWQIASCYPGSFLHFSVVVIIFVGHMTTQLWNIF